MKPGNDFCAVECRWCIENPENDPLRSCILDGHPIIRNTSKGRMKHRTSSNWRYKIIKNYRKRAVKFMDEAPNKQEAFSWALVVGWFDSILESRFVNQHGAISLPFVEVPEP